MLLLQRVEGIPWIIHSIFLGNLFHLSASVTFFFFLFFSRTFSSPRKKFVSRSGKRKQYFFYYCCCCYLFLFQILSEEKGGNPLKDSGVTSAVDIQRSARQISNRRRWKFLQVCMNLHGLLHSIGVYRKRMGYRHVYIIISPPFQKNRRP